jgi:hypothetical protein
MSLFEASLGRNPRACKVALLDATNEFETQRLVKILKVHSLGVPHNTCKK